VAKKPTQQPPTPIEPQEVTPEEVAQLQQAEKNRLEQIRIIEELIALETATESFKGWCEYVLGLEGLVPPKHAYVMIDELEKVATGENRRLIMNLPPGYAKSIFTSILFPPYFILKNPKCSVIGASNTIALATKFSRKARDMIKQHTDTIDYELDPDQKAATAWKTTTGAEYIAVGAGSSILGNRADLFLIDDPYASMRDASNPTKQTEIWDWFKSDVFSRQKDKKSRIVIVMTRFHQTDLVGQILQEQPDQWKVVRIPCICEDEETDPVGRKVGEYLWADVKSPADADIARRLGGERNWVGNYQQRPAPDEGNMFDVTKLEIVNTIPHRPDENAVSRPIPIVATSRAWDIAVNEGKGDYLVGILFHRLADGRFYVEDIVRERGGPQVVEQLILKTAAEDRAKHGRVIIFLPEDPAAAGKLVVSYLTRALAGFIVKSEAIRGDKETLAMPVASQCNIGNILMKKAKWNDDFKQELMLFPASKYDDQVDALAYAFTMICAPPKQTEQIYFDWFNR
jgi:predicted phage terminase large subunit-like protein